MTVNSLHMAYEYYRNNINTSAFMVKMYLRSLFRSTPISDPQLLPSKHKDNHSNPK